VNARPQRGGSKTEDQQTFPQKYRAALGARYYPSEYFEAYQLDYEPPGNQLRGGLLNV